MFRLAALDGFGLEAGLGLVAGLVGVRESEPQAAKMARHRVRSALAVLPAVRIKRERSSR
jgi:hypothetical protein